MERRDVRDKKRIAIIGAGSSGLTAIKCCLDEGLLPVCLEKGSDIGGLWRFSPDVVDATASIYNSLVINTSKFMMMFSDFPPPDCFPPFLTHENVFEYFRLYAKHFHLLPHIMFHTQVCHVTKSSDYDSTGQWDVTFRRQVTAHDCCQHLQDVVSERFDGVMICTGHHSVPHIPHIPGLDTFQGTVLHSHAYKDASPFHGKRVVILGFGNSAVDIACDLAKSAQQVYLSSRRGAWIVPRTAFWGLPADMLANSRLVFTMPYRLLDWCVQLQANFRIDHATYGIKPAHGVLNCHPTINDELPVHLVSGRVQTRANILCVDTNSVQFDDLTVCPCDVIILATGYEYRVDVVDEQVFKVDNNRSRLYKYMFPPHLSKPTLAIIGLVQSIGASMPISEMQSRWFARIMTGAAKLPSQQEMIDDINMKEAAMSDLYVRSRRHTLQTFWIDYMDQVAAHIGVRPCLWKLMCLDPELALKCYLGPCLPAQYRLMGPGSWTGARQFIVSALSRVTKFKPLDKAPCAGSTDWRGHASCREITGVPVSTPGSSTGPHCSYHLQTAGAQVSLVGKAGSPAERTTRPTSEGRPGSRSSSQWTTFAFYVVVMAICCIAWLLSVLCNQAESLLNVVDKKLPLVD
ncbi:unnamed protein product [Candidula unifasciata]|uniref:Flavin-containing monooxygenase n=1 Tax=Candidula unifasciata TaxID=100452 RepID=A0A8S4A0K6_9EUPU|nr:unnamed protein product [Candidula unifasciata]